jgi:UDP-glucose 4-epimerase
MKGQRAKMRVLVTGGAGFIGSHLVEGLVAEGLDVRVLDNFSAGTKDNLAPVLKKIEVREGDIRDVHAVERASEGMEVVFHLAALGSVPRSVEDPLTTNAVNVDGTLNVLIAARKAGVRRVVYASSSSVYGDTPSLPKAESLPTVPVSPYGVSKLAGELYCRSFWQVYGLETFSLRYFNVFGPRQDPRSQYAAVIPLFASHLLSGRAPVVFGDGEQTRDFTYVANVVRANLLAMRAARGFGGAFNVAAGNQVTVNDLARKLRDLAAASSAMIEHAAPRPGDVRHSYADISLAQEVLGYQPVVALDEGLRRTMEWYRDERDARVAAAG